MRFRPLTISTLVVIVTLSACQPAKPPPQATAQDVEATKAEVQKEVAEARAEASKDVKSASKVSGADVRVVSEAKVTGTYDVAMAKADGDRKVATEQCLTLPADQQSPCNDKANADYETAAAAAKSARLARKL